jgi:predicted metal-dependent peptidase
MVTKIHDWFTGFVNGAEFVEKYPYYAAILAKLSPVADPSVKRMAVSLHDGRFFLHVNVDSFLSEPQYLRGILLHEVHHVVLGHLTHPKFAEPAEPELMDIAVVISANEHVEEPLPNPITWRGYSAFGIRPGQSTVERYEILTEHVRKTGARPRPRPSDGGEPATSPVDDHRYLRAPTRAPGGVAQTAMMLERALSDAPPLPTKEQDKRIRSDDDIPRRFTVAGRLPGRLLEELQGTTLPPEHFIDWPAALTMFVARARSPVHTWSRPNRRFPERVFAVPGRTWAPRRLSEPRLLVAIDTSLSMTRVELEEIARQLVRLGENAHVTIAECDVEVTRVYPFAGTLDTVTGRGGTDLRPVFSPDRLKALDVDGVVYFTDGDGPFPTEPAIVPTLWVLTKPAEFRCPWGERARLTRRRRAA